MTSNRQERKREATNWAPEPLMMLSNAASKAAKEARGGGYVAIAKLVDDAAVKNGGRFPCPKRLRSRKFSKFAPC
jgi:hypothetical protein